MWIRCFPIYIDRVLDNLLSNASNAIPERGESLSIRSYRQDCWAVAEIINTGQISEEERDRFIHRRRQREGASHQHAIDQKYERDNGRGV